MLKNDFYFLDNKIHKENIGEHDGDNRFLCEGIENLMTMWKETHEGCTPIGICYEFPHEYCHGFYPMVYEDENGDRFWTHIDVWTIKEYMELENE